MDEVDPTAPPAGSWQDHLREAEARLAAGDRAAADTAFTAARNAAVAANDTDAVVKISRRRKEAGASRSTRAPATAMRAPVEPPTEPTIESAPALVAEPPLAAPVQLLAKEREQRIASLRAGIERELTRRTYQGYQEAVNLLRQLLALDPQDRRKVELQLMGVVAQFDEFARTYGELHTAQARQDLEGQIQAIQRLVSDGINEGSEGESLPMLLAELTNALRRRLNESARRHLAVAQTALAQAQILFDEGSAALAAQECREVLEQPNVVEIDQEVREEIEVFHRQARAYQQKIAGVNRLLAQARTAQQVGDSAAVRAALTEATHLAGEESQPLPLGPIQAVETTLGAAAAVAPEAARWYQEAVRRLNAGHLATARAWAIWGRDHSSDPYRAVFAALLDDITQHKDAQHG